MNSGTHSDKQLAFIAEQARDALLAPLIYNPHKRLGQQDICPPPHPRLFIEQLPAIYQTLKQLSFLHKSDFTRPMLEK